jgi:hypothetical protein
MSETNCGSQVEAAFTTKALTDGRPLMVVMWNMHLEHASGPLGEIAIPTPRDLTLFDNFAGMFPCLPLKHYGLTTAFHLGRRLCAALVCKGLNHRKAVTERRAVWRASAVKAKKRAAVEEDEVKAVYDTRLNICNEAIYP